MLKLNMFCAASCIPYDWKPKSDITTIQHKKAEDFFDESILPKLHSDEDDVVDGPKSPKSQLEKGTGNKNLFETMKFEKNRVNSFDKKWPLDFISSKDLAESGFFYLQSDDKVQCAFCKLILNDWKLGDRPLKEHIKNSPKCPFLVTSGNESKSRPKLQHSSSYCSEYTPSTSISCKPKIPRMADIKTRLLTFKGWPLTAISPEDLADCGLFYTGVADVVTCFSCGGSLGNWEPFDDPVNEHTKFYPHCLYLRLLQHRPLVRQKKITNSQNAAERNPHQSLKQVLAGELLKSEVVQQAKEIFPSSLVENVVLQHLKQTGQTFTSLHQLCEKVLEHDEKRLKNRLNPIIKLEDVTKCKGTSDITKNVSVNGISNFHHEKDVLLCKICMDRERGIVFQPCGHLVACEKCAALISECPLCRKPIKSRVKTYLS